MNNEEADLERRFGGLARLYGAQGAKRIRAAHVAIIGIGGVGSWAAECLARSGVSQITLFDLDHIAESNINRQIHALNETIGQAKVDAMQTRIQAIHPACVVNKIEDFVTPENWLSLCPPDVDAVIDACDQVKTKTALAAWARLQHVKRSTSEKPPVIFISVGAAGGKRLAHYVEIDDLSQTTHDPLLAQVRYRLRKEKSAPAQGKRFHVSCVFSREAVQAPDSSCAIENADHSLNCHGYGSVVSVTATFGQCAAGWILNELSQLSLR